MWTELFTLNTYCPCLCLPNDHTLYLFVLPIQAYGYLCKGHVVELGNYPNKAILWEITVSLRVEMLKSCVKPEFVK